MRTRFAPSPTGLLHVGGLRTALYAYLLAKQTGGEFLLRIEDTDRERHIDGAITSIVEVLHWAGLVPDEGVILAEGGVQQRGGKGPYIQSERLDIYRRHAQALIASGNAYYAFDTKEDIENMRREQQGAGVAAPKYDASVRLQMRNAFTMSDAEVRAELDAGTPYVIRMQVDPDQTIAFQDDIRGHCVFQGHEVDDQVLLKSDGFPTYHLAHVVDDHLMDIGLVLRGEEWLSSLPKHLLLFQYFGWQAPRYAHVPLLLNKDRTKLSKRQNDVDVGHYIARGYLPEAMLNFLAFLGWNPGTTQEIFPLAELIEAFSLERVQKAGAVFDTDKLDWLQGQWMRRMDAEAFVKRILPIVAEQYPSAQNDADFLQKAVLIQDRITFLHEAPAMLSYFYAEPDVSSDLLVNAKQKVTVQQLPEILEALIDTLSSLSVQQWNQENLEDVLLALAKTKGWKNSQVLWPLRAVLTGLPFSPGAFEVAVALGRDVTIRRLSVASGHI